MFGGEKIKGWKLVQSLTPQIIELGIAEGVIQSQKEKREIIRNFNISGLFNSDGSKAERKGTDGRMNLPTDLSLLHSAIPFLPVPLSILCFIENVLLPGLGTVNSGIFALCFGETRINYREGRKLMTLVINTLVGISQFFTIPFMFVGWFWSIAWGITIVTYAVQYRDAVRQQRKEAIAIAALEVLTRDSILHRRDVRALVQEKGKAEAK